MPSQVIDYEREKKEIETAIAKKEKEVSGQQSSLEDEQNQVRGGPMTKEQLLSMYRWFCTAKWGGHGSHQGLGVSSLSWCWQ